MPTRLHLSRSAKATYWKLKNAEKAVEKAESPITPGKPNGILKAVPVSFALCNFLGVREASRTQAAIKVWDHIKRNNLQNDKGEIICDDRLKPIFDWKSKVRYLEVGKLLTPHFLNRNYR